MNQRAAPADARLAEAVIAGLGGTLPPRLGVAVSGGGDSIALMHLLHAHCAAAGSVLRVVTVDHGLRPEAAEEAHFVARQAAALGLSHDTLAWRGWDGQGNLQNAARDARYGLMADWARRHDLPIVALGHTADDQAETLIMRLARRAGVDGLSGMDQQSHRLGITWTRPMLAVRRQTLRTYLQRHHIEWVEDPSNDDPHYTRIRTRQTLAAVAPLGLEPEALADVAANMASARAALDHYADWATAAFLRNDAGAVVIEAEGFFALPEEIRRRLMLRAIGWISAKPYAPRSTAVRSLIDGLAQGRAGTLDGCQALRRRGEVWVFREFNAVKDITTPVKQLWDSRWRAQSAAPPSASVQLRALGQEGLTQCPTWRDTRRPRAVLLSTPAIWQGDTLLAAPLAGLAQKWHVQLERDAAWLKTAPLSH